MMPACCLVEISTPCYLSNIYTIDFAAEFFNKVEKGKSTKVVSSNQDNEHLTDDEDMGMNGQNSNNEFSVFLTHHI